MKLHKYCQIKILPLAVLVRERVGVRVDGLKKKLE